jgi:16S rRNA (cytosine967-C5)-methyltransferase
MLLNPRQVAFFALRDVHKGAFVDVAIDRILNKTNLANFDRRLVTELVYGSVRRQRTIDAIIDKIAKKKSQQQPKDLRTILHLGLYQLRYQERIPASAAVNTTVDLAKENGFPGLTGLVNGILRQYLRLIDAGDEIITSSNPVERLGILYSFPDWIIQVWIEQFGLEETEKLCNWMNQTPAIDLRVNLLRTTVETVEEAFTIAGVKYQRLQYLPCSLRLLGHNGRIQDLPGFEDGWWTVQDSSAQLVGYLLDPQPNEVVIDTCAAPGGKTTHIAELMQDRGTIWACDRTASRMGKLKENIQRLQIQSIETCVGDSRELPQFTGIADRVLLDAPCSGLGTLHRHADARWRQTSANIHELAKLQTELLSQTSKFVKPGGILVYATCTLHTQENEAVIALFLENHPNWQIEIPNPQSPLAVYARASGLIKVLPHNQDMDGFFMVRLRKANNSG